MEENKLLVQSDGSFILQINRPTNLYRAVQITFTPSDGKTRIAPKSFNPIESIHYERGNPSIQVYKEPRSFLETVCSGLIAGGKRKEACEFLQDVFQEGGRRQKQKQRKFLYAKNQLI